MTRPFLAVFRYGAPELRGPPEAARRAARVAGHVRLDEPGALAERLGLARDAGAFDVVLAAWERWGERCVEELRGDFAFVVADAHRRRLFAARDRFGTRPLYVAAVDGGAVVGGALGDVVRFSGVRRELDELAVVDLLASLEPDPERTLLAGVRRVPAGHAWSIGPGGVGEVRRYYTIEPPPRLHLRDDAAFAEAFLEALARAVRRRLGGDAIGAALSGGLDSSSVAACAARALADDGRGPLATFSLVFPGQREDESTWIDAATASSRVDATRIDATRLDPFARVDTWLDALGEPFFGPNVYLMDACWAAAAERGCAAFLDGFDGDTVVSHGTNAIAEWALGGRIVRALREARGVARSFERPFARVAARSILRPALPRTAWRSVRGRRSHDIGLVHRDLAVRTRLAERVADVEPPARTEVAGHLRRLRSPMLSVGLEISCRLGASRGVEVRSPFVDQDLVELCLSLPPEQKLRDGTTRFVLRRAMEGLLPPVVCERSGKTDVSGNFHRNVARGHPVLDEVASGADDLDGLVDPVALRSVVARYRDAGGGSEAMSIWSTLLLLRWLRAARPERSGRG